MLLDRQKTLNLLKTEILGNKLIDALEIKFLSMRLGRSYLRLVKYVTYFCKLCLNLF